MSKWDIQDSLVVMLILNMQQRMEYRHRPALAGFRNRSTWRTATTAYSSKSWLDACRDHSSPSLLRSCKSNWLPCRPLRSICMFNTVALCSRCSYTDLIVAARRYHRSVGQLYHHHRTLDRRLQLESLEYIWDIIWYSFWPAWQFGVLTVIAL